MDFLTDKKFIVFLVKFLLTFCVLYYGTIAFIGITAPGGYYSPFADKHLDYVAGLRFLLLQSSRAVLALFGWHTYLKDVYTIKLLNGSGVHIGYDCIGYGVIFFWVAFIYANEVAFAKKIKWMLAGITVIWLVNVIRISLMLVAVNNKWMPLFSLDNHTWFNIAAYSVIFTMIYLFDMSEKKAAMRNNSSKL